MVHSTDIHGPQNMHVLACMGHTKINDSEASFSTNSDGSVGLQIIQMPRSLELVIFVLMTMITNLHTS